MENRFDHFFERNRNGFDVEQPDDERIWNAIHRQIRRPAVYRRRLLRIAASVALFVALGVTTFLMMKHHSARQPDAWQTAYPEFPDHETRTFSLAVMESMKRVESAPLEPHSYQEMAEQLREIDRDLETYYTDLQVFGSQPRILKGIIRCYELKIKIIERTLSESAKNQHHEKQRELL